MNPTSSCLMSTASGKEWLTKCTKVLPKEVPHLCKAVRKPARIGAGRARACGGGACGAGRAARGVRPALGHVVPSDPVRQHGRPFSGWDRSCGDRASLTSCAAPPRPSKIIWHILCTSVCPGSHVNHEAWRTGATPTERSDGRCYKRLAGFPPILQVPCTQLTLKCDAQCYVTHEIKYTNTTHARQTLRYASPYHAV